MRLLDNMRINAKTLISPIVCSILVVVIGAIFWSTSTDIQQATQDTENYGVFADHAMQAKINFADAHNGIYKAMAYQQTNVDKKQIDEVLAGAKKSFQATQKNIDELDFAMFGTSEETIKKLKDNIKAYGDSVSQYAEVSTSDPSMSDFFVNDCQSRYNPTRAILDELAKTADDKAAEVRKGLSQTVHDSLVSVLGFVALTVVAAMALGFFIGHAISWPIQRITKIMQILATGDKTVDVPQRGRRDEIGEMLKAVAIFKQNAIEMEQMQAEQETAKKRSAQERQAIMLQMADEFEQNVKGVVGAVSSAATQMQANAQSMATIAEKTSSQASAVAAASQEASSNVHAVAAASEELNASIGEITRQISDSTRVTSSCVDEAEGARSVVQDLNKAAEQIGDIVKLIENIASQVNLLALNATIEAARAGEAGRGFAVVATEVKNLANQAGAAAQDITTQITNVQAKTAKAVEAIESITTTIKRVNEISTAIASAVEEQGAATKEISSNVQQASQGNDEVTRNITEVTLAISDTGNASGQVLVAAQQLSRESETLSKAVNTFVAKIRAE